MPMLKQGKIVQIKIEGSMKRCVLFPATQQISKDHIVNSLFIAILFKIFTFFIKYNGVSKSFTIFIF